MRRIFGAMAVVGLGGMAVMGILVGGSVVISAALRTGDWSGVLAVSLMASGVIGLLGWEWNQ
jgi:hypothetical protein